MRRNISASLGIDLEPSEWEVESTLGNGSTGKVFRARAPDGSQWAVKVLHPHVVSAIDIDHVKTTFAHLRGTNHPAVPRNAQITDFRGDIVVIHEYRQCVDLETLVSGGAIPIRAALQLSATIAEALEAARLTPDNVGDPLNIRHGDLKPSNILMGSDGSIAIIDFGMSKVKANKAALTPTMFYDSRGFMSPERIDNQQSDRCDLYSLALMLSYFVTGDRPTRTSGHEVRRQIIIKRVRESIDGDAAVVADLIGQTLSYKPEDRPSLKDFARVCRDLYEDLPGVELDEWARSLVGAFQQSTDEIRFLDDGSRLSLAGRTPMHPGPRGREPTPAPAPSRPDKLGQNFWAPLALLLLFVGTAAVIGAFALAVD